MSESRAKLLALKQRARHDLELYARLVLKIRTEAGSVVPFRFNNTQRYIHRRIEEQKERTGCVRVIIPKGRKQGCSTYAEGRGYRAATCWPGWYSMVVAHSRSSTSKLFEMSQRFHEHAGDLWRPSTGTANANQLRFDRLDSGYDVATAGGSEIGRGMTINFLHASEFAFWQNAGMHVLGLFNAVPKASGSEIIVESTANGMNNEFHKMVRAAEAGDSDFEVIFCPWHLHEGNVRVIIPSNWRPSTWWREYQRQHNLSEGQLYWAWCTNRDTVSLHGGDVDEAGWAFKQEFPATLDEAFQAGGERPFIHPDHIMRARTQPELNGLGGTGPMVIGVDVAHSWTGDKTAIIDRVGRVAGKNVNELLTTPNAMELVAILARRINDYHPAAVFIDASEGSGRAVCDRLIEMGYGRVVRPVKFGAKPIGAGPGATTDYANRRSEMWDSMRAWFECEVYDTVAVPSRDDVLHGDVAAPQWGPGATRRDSEIRLHLEPKDNIRARLGRSPDKGDALALTFAEQAPPESVTRDAMPAPSDERYDDYDPLENL